MVTVAALTSQTTRDVHTAEERLFWRVTAERDVAELTLYRRVVALVNDVKQTVALRQHVNLSTRHTYKIYTRTNTDMYMYVKHCHGHVQHL